MFWIFSMNAVGSIRADRAERRRLVGLPEEPLRSPSPPENSVIATGKGWIVPWVMSRRSTALAGRTPRTVAAAAPLAVASSWRRDHEAATIEFCFALVGIVFLLFWRGASAAAEHVARIESDLHVLPDVVLGGRHRIGLAAAHRAHGALGGDAEIGAGAAVHQLGLGRQRAVGPELDAQADDQLLR